MQVQGPFRRHNSTPVSSFMLTAFVNPGPLRWLFFCALLMLYLFMILANVLLICVIALNSSLHEPMYMFLCSLFVNELYGSSALFPFLLVHILQDVHMVPAGFCFFQIFAIHGYGLVELFTLAGMSYDRYIAICHPLHYTRSMSWKTTRALIVWPWVFALLWMGIAISLSSSLELCGNTIDKVYCDNYPIVKLACYDTTSINIHGIVATITTIVNPFIVILYTYIRILRVCWGGEHCTRQKAVNTCAPHLATVLNFTVAAFFEIIQNRFKMSHVPNMLRIFLSLYFLLCQPLFNPLIYGLVLTKIRLICKDLLLRAFKTAWKL